MNDVATTDSNPPAAPVDAAAYRKIADEAGGGAELLKFRKGKFVRGADDQEVGLGTRFACNVPELARGFVRFTDDGVEKVMVRPGEPTIARDSLGDIDEDLWERDDNGVAQDPWNASWEMPLKDLATGEELVFATSSRGGIGALGRVANAYGSRLATKGDGAVPIVELAASTYKHARYGEVDIPQLKLIGFEQEVQLVASESNGADDLNDAIPY